MTTVKIIQTDENGVSSYAEVPVSAVNNLVSNGTELVPRRLARLNCSYADNVTETTSSVNVWERFPYPSTGYTVYRQHLFDVDPAMSRFTYTGPSPRWFMGSAFCNVIKGSGVGANRDILFQWRLNGAPIGGVVRGYMGGFDAQVIGGEAPVYLSNGDYLEPWIVNTENSDNVLLFNCKFNFVEDLDVVWGD